jgi:hypothetical protein
VIEESLRTQVSGDGRTAKVSRSRSPRQPQSGQRWWACSGRSAAPHMGQSASGAKGERSIRVGSIEANLPVGPRRLWDAA